MRFHARHVERLLALLEQLRLESDGGRLRSARLYSDNKIGTLGASPYLNVSVVDPASNISVDQDKELVDTDLVPAPGPSVP